MTALEFKNELIRRLNQNANRYHGGTCNGREYPNIETFDVDEVYEIIDSKNYLYMKRMKQFVQNWYLIQKRIIFIILPLKIFPCWIMNQSDLS